MSLPVDLTPEVSTRTQIAALVFCMINAVLFGAGLIVVLMVPGLNAHAGFSIAVVTWIDGSLSSSQAIVRSGASPARTTSGPSAGFGSPGTSGDK